MIITNDVKKILAKHILTDGFDIIVDLKNSHGSRFVDRRNGDQYLDFFTMFASMSVGFNHPKLLAAKEKLGGLAVQKPSNSDAYTVAMAECVETFSQIGIPDYLPHAFFISGGGLAVENALKTAFDWKVRKNFEKGSKKVVGTQIIHFKQSFHGRTGYTLSLTNTADPRKTAYFPIFDWPRIVNPKITFPLNEKNLEIVQVREQEALRQIRNVTAKEGDDIAGLIIEPIQGEGGDNHFRMEFFQALREICDEHDILFIMDEVQTGVGMTGKFWAHEHFVRPDIISFGKKSQVCGILASKRIDEVEHHVFEETSRINSTFGGNLIDMVRFTYILWIIEEEGLVENARIQGGLLLTEIQKLAGDFPNQVSNPRGRGLMCAFDLVDGKMRDTFLERLFEKKLLIMGCGEKSIRFRPHLIITADEIMEAIGIIRSVLNKSAKP